MRASLKLTGVTVAILLAAGAGIAAGDHVQIRDRDQLKDGSCQVAGDQSRQRDRDQLKDGSC